MHPESRSAPVPARGDGRLAVYSDGSCPLGVPGPAGWAWIIPGGACLNGFSSYASPARMELTAALSALRWIGSQFEPAERADIVLHTDWEPLVACFERGLWQTWQARNWRTRAGHPVADRDLWEALAEEAARLPVRFQHVPAHSGDMWNDAADRLASAAVAAGAGVHAPSGPLGGGEALAAAPLITIGAQPHSRPPAALNSAPAPTGVRSMPVDREDASSLVHNPHLSPAHIEALAETQDPAILEQVAAHPRTPAAVLATIGHATNTHVRLHLGEHLHTPPSMLEVLVDDDDWHVGLAAIRNPSTPAATLWRLGCETGAARAGELRAAVAANPATPGALLETLSRDPDRWVRAAVAAHPRASKEVLRRLAHDPEADVRGATAQNPTTPSGDLGRLARESIRFGRTVAANPACPEAAARWLAEQGHALHELAANPATPADLLDSLLAKRAELRLHSIANPSVPRRTLDRAARSRDKYARCLAAGHPNTRPDVLRRLRGDQASSVRLCLAENPQADPASLRHLSTDSEPVIRAAVGRHVATPAATLVQLLHDTDSHVRRTVIANPATPAGAVHDLLGVADTRTRRAVLRHSPAVADLLTGTDLGAGLDL